MARSLRHEHGVCGSPTPWTPPRKGEGDYVAPRYLTNVTEAVAPASPSPLRGGVRGGGSCRTQSRPPAPVLLPIAARPLKLSRISPSRLAGGDLSFRRWPSRTRPQRPARVSRAIPQRRSPVRSIHAALALKVSALRTFHVELQQEQPVSTCSRVRILSTVTVGTTPSRDLSAVCRRWKISPHSPLPAIAQASPRPPSGPAPPASTTTLGAWTRHCAAAGLRFSAAGSRHDDPCSAGTSRQISAPPYRYSRRHRLSGLAGSAMPASRLELRPKAVDAPPPGPAIPDRIAMVKRVRAGPETCRRMPSRFGSQSAESATTGPLNCHRLEKAKAHAGAASRKARRGGSTARPRLTRASASARRGPWPRHLRAPASASRNR